MNYEESKAILEEIKQAKRILINCHIDPDPDSIGSALAIYSVLQKMGISADVVCTGSELYESVNYLSGYDNIQKGVDFKNFIGPIMTCLFLRTPQLLIVRLETKI